MLKEHSGTLPETITLTTTFWHMRLSHEPFQRALVGTIKSPEGLGCILPTCDSCE